MKAAAITAPPKTSMPSGGGIGAPLSRTSTPGNVHAAMIANLTCQTGRDEKLSPIVPAVSVVARRVPCADVAPGRGRVPRLVRTPGWCPRSSVTGRHTGMAAQSDSRTEAMAIRTKSTKTARIANDRMRSGTSAIG